MAVENNIANPQPQSGWTAGVEFLSLAEAIPWLVFVNDRDGRHVYTNAEFQRYVGLTAENLLGARVRTH